MKIQKKIDKRYADSNHLLIDGRYELYEDGTVYDMEKSEDIPQWIFEFRDFVADYSRRETVEEIKNDLLRIATKGELEELRREVEYYFKK